MQTLDLGRNIGVVHYFKIIKVKNNLMIERR